MCSNRITIIARQEVIVKFPYVAQLYQNKRKLMVIAFHFLILQKEKENQEKSKVFFKKDLLFRKIYAIIPMLHMGV